MANSPSVSKYAFIGTTSAINGPIPTAANSRIWLVPLVGMRGNAWLDKNDNPILFRSMVFLNFLGLNIISLITISKLFGVHWFY